MVLALTVILSGCTSLRPVTGAPEDLRQRINTGALLKAGDSVLIVTTYGKVHRFEVTGVSDGVIQGRTDSVPVDQLASLEKRVANPLGTATLVIVALAVGSLAVVAHTGAGLSGH